MKKLIPLLAFAVVILTAAAQDKPNPSVYGDIPDYGEKYLSPDFVKLDKKAGILVACRTGDELLKINPETKAVESRIALGGHPSGIAVSPDGKFAYVTIAAPKGEILKISLGDSKIAERAPAGHMPRAVIISADGKTLYFANQFENVVRAFDSKTLKETAWGKAVRDPFSLALSKDGSKLFAANQLPESKGGLYEENIGAAVSVFDAKTLKTLAKIDLPNGSINAQDIKVSPNGKFAYLTHVVARFNVPTTQVERGWINTNAVSLVDTQKNTLYATFLLDDIELGGGEPVRACIYPRRLKTARHPRRDTRSKPHRFASTRKTAGR